MQRGRRKFLLSAVGGGAFLIGGRSALAEACSITPEETTGPFIPDDFPFRAEIEGFPFIIAHERDADLTTVAGRAGAATGQALNFRGKIVDENCQPVAGAGVFLWQADDRGHYNHSEDPNITVHPDPAGHLDPGFQYRGAVLTDGDGRFGFRTIKPKYYPLDPMRPDYKRTAHLHIGVMKDGFEPLFTQAYFEGNVLEDIDEIRRLNRIDILLGEWTGDGADRRPTGRINPVFIPLIVEYKEERGLDAPAGDIRLSIARAGATG